MKQAESQLLPPANEVWGKVIFLHLFVILFGGSTWAGTSRQVHSPSGPGTPPSGQGTPRQVHPPGAGTPPWDQVHPLGPGTPPWDQVHPQDQVHPPQTRYTPHPAHSMLGDTVNARAVRIPLDCILAYSCAGWARTFFCFWSIVQKNCMKMKRNGSREGEGACVPRGPSWILQCK